MPQVKNSQYQHLGAGTAILGKKLKHACFQKTGKINGSKQSATILQMNKYDTVNNKLIIGNIQAENGNGAKKWKLLRT